MKNENKTHRMQCHGTVRNGWPAHYINEHSKTQDINTTKPPSLWCRMGQFPSTEMGFGSELEAWVPASKSTLPGRGL